MANSESKGKVLGKAGESLKNKVMPKINFEELIEVILVPKIAKSWRHTGNCLMRLGNKAQCRQMKGIGQKGRLGLT